MSHAGQWGSITLWDAAADGNLEAIKVFFFKKKMSLKN